MANKEQEEASGTYRYCITLPETLLEQVRAYSNEKGYPVATTIRRCLRMGLIFQNVADHGGHIIKKEGDRETELIIL